MDGQSSTNQGVSNEINTTDAKGYSDAPASTNPLTTVGYTDQLATNIAETITHRLQYAMNHKHRGMALIFNHEFFNSSSLERRNGTNVDCAKLFGVLKRLDFDVIEYKDLCHQEIVKKVKQIALESEYHENSDCIAVFILSHGGMGYINARDVEYKLDTICCELTADNCPTLANKPKLFFIQACQGDRFDEGVTMQSERIETEGSSTTSYKIPIHADFLIAYSTIPGFYSWRNTKLGSWYMQSLCEQLDANGKRLDMLTLLTIVGQQVAVNYEAAFGKKSNKQMPSFTTMLTRILLFSDKKNKLTT